MSEHRETFDAVVIGSGPNGLSAAIAMAQGGASVLVLEAADEIGGRAFEGDFDFRDAADAASGLGIAGAGRLLHAEVFDVRERKLESNQLVLEAKFGVERREEVDDLGGINFHGFVGEIAARTRYRLSKVEQPAAEGAK